MNLSFKNTFKALAMGGVLLLGACNDALNVEPRLSISASTAYSTEASLNAALNGVYARLRSLRIYGRDLIAIPEALSDNGRATFRSGRLGGEFQNQAGAHMDNWQVGYYAINQANLILDAAATIQLSAASKTNIEGQAKFLRALFYFDIVKSYAYIPTAVVSASDRGGVPLLLKGVDDITEASLPSRAKTDDVYDQIEKDLNEAATALATFNRGVGYPSRTAALALLSRVSLYRGKHQAVVDFATQALANTPIRPTFVANAQYISAWRTPVHPESIFEVQFNPSTENSGVNESLQTTFTTFSAAPPAGIAAGWGDLVPTAALLADHETGDIRRNLYTLGFNNRGAAEIECIKYVGKNGLNSDNAPVIRTSELILNRAEALARLGRDADASRDLNQIRTRAGLPEVTLTGQALLAEILKQRRVELAFEGHRFFDLKRQGVDIVKVGTPNLTFSDFRVLARIPIREVQINSNLQQNAGY